MKDLTPTHLRCSHGGCPGVVLMPGNIVRVTGLDQDGKERWVELGIEYFAGLAREIVLTTSSVDEIRSEDHSSARAQPSGPGEVTGK